MKAISSSSIFHLPRDRAGGFCGYSSSNRSFSLKIFAKKSKNNEPSPSKDSKPPPPRIKSNLKQNLQIIKFWKDHLKRKSSKPRPSTSYRKKKVEKEDLPEETVPSQDPILPLDLDVDIEGGASPVLLVDGYNICGYWSKMKKDFKSGRLDIARQKLIDELVSYSGMRGVKVVVVFDAMMSGFHTHKENFRGIDVVYTGESSADTWILKEVALLRDDGCPGVWVATSDRFGRDSAIGKGALVWSSKALVAEIEDSNKEFDIMERYRPTSMQGRLLKHNLKPKVVDALKELRNKLAAQESRRP